MEPTARQSRRIIELCTMEFALPESSREPQTEGISDPARFESPFDCRRDAPERLEHLTLDPFELERTPRRDSPESD
jgi:hypothetical protein